jgi:transposase
MAGVYKMTISESKAELKQLLITQKTGVNKERIQLLYLLKTEQVATVTAAAKIIGRNRVTAQDWMSKYRAGGIERLLERKTSSGRPKIVPNWAEKTLAKQLEETEGFNSYQEIQEWVSINLGIEVKYKTLHKLVHYRLKASPKVARPVSKLQSSVQKEAYKKTL